MRETLFVGGLILSLGWSAFVVANPNDDECTKVIRDGSFRSLPEWGRPKESRVDYKLINQFLLSLHRAIERADPLPAGFTAKTAPKTWLASPVKGVLLTGILQAPHRLAGLPINIMLQREGVAFVATVYVDGARTRFEKAMPPEEISDIFPYQPPKGHGGLISIVNGVQINPNMDGWDEVPTAASP